MKYILPFIFILICNVNKAKAQTMISGIVSDELGVLPDVNIIVEGGKKGTTTNNDGYFEITAKKNDVLSISYVGFETKNVWIDNQKNIVVTLGSTITLEEVTIVASRHNACRSTSTSIRCYTVSYDCGEEEKRIKEEAHDTNALKLYPNPSPKGVFILNLLQEYGEVEVWVTNVSGQSILIKSFRNPNRRLKIDLSRYPTGMYIVNTMADGKTLPVKKAIVG